MTIDFGCYFWNPEIEFLGNRMQSQAVAVSHKQSQAFAGSRPWVVLRSFWGRSRVVLRSFWNRSRVVLESFWNRSEIGFGWFWGYPEIVLESL